MEQCYMGICPGSGTISIFTGNLNIGTVSTQLICERCQAGDRW